LNQKGFPDDVQNKIFSSVEYSWTKKQGLTDDALFGDLPPEVRIQISEHLYVKLIESVPLFQGTDLEFKTAICKVLRNVSIPENEVLFKAGDEGNGNFGFFFNFFFSPCDN
jgi:hypothetical protein